MVVLVPMAARVAWSFALLCNVTRVVAQVVLPLELPLALSLALRHRSRCRSHCVVTRVALLAVELS